jgi:predicted RNA-binding protein associated with RNAse of E/G family
VRRPRREFGKVVVANGYFAAWFIFRRRWYDVGKFYDRDGNFTGYYCDIIRPVSRLLSSASKTAIITDLFLDLWIDSDGKYAVLDEDQLERALGKHAISNSLARRARSEMRALIMSTRAGHFPPMQVKRFQPLMNNLLG